ncbi:MAG: hypothetical protein OSJ74_10330, partial [Clostridia bacterium]|nr:hypothetical protein [Clostridia bacterium]
GNSSQVNGWTGIKMAASNKVDVSVVENDETKSMLMDMKASGAFLFDGSAMAITGSQKATTVIDEERNTDLKLGVYGKDKTSYFDLGVGENNVKVKLGEKPSLLDGALESVLATMSKQFVTLATSAVTGIVCEMSYDDIVKEYGDGFKAYVNDNGNYNRIKYVFTKEMVCDLADYVTSDLEEEFLKAATFGECSMILVFDKETNTFQGAKLQLNYDFNFKDEANKGAFSLKINTSASIENCEKVDMPSNFDDYKEIKDISQEDIDKILEGITY